VPFVDGTKRLQRKLARAFLPNKEHYEKLSKISALDPPEDKIFPRHNLKVSFFCLAFHLLLFLFLFFFLLFFFFFFFSSLLYLGVQQLIFRRSETARGQRKGEKHKPETTGVLLRQRLASSLP
jgi:hypothetical protein